MQPSASASASAYKATGLGLTNKPAIRNLFREYALHGGFPEVVLSPRTEDKELLLKSSFEAILIQGQ